MGDLLERGIRAHGGIERWDQVSRFRAETSITGGIWALKGKPGLLENQQGWGNVMYIPAAPWCPRNERYAAPVRTAFATGSSPDDFPAEHNERDWAGRFGADDLNETGRRGLGLS
jgi:hypothetical protein